MKCPTCEEVVLVDAALRRGAVISSAFTKCACACVCACACACVVFARRVGAPPEGERCQSDDGHETNERYFISILNGITT